MWLACCIGGGIYAITAATTISDNRVFDNAADHGGGLFAWNLASATLAANTVHSNASAGNGGGMLLSGCVNAMLTGNQVYSNVATVGGGGLYLDGSDYAVLSQNDVRDNDLTDVCGGGAGAVLAASTGVLFQGNSLWGNRSNYRGGGLLLYDSSTTTVRGNAFYLNQSRQGGGLFVRFSDGTYVDHNAIFGNTSIPTSTAISECEGLVGGGGIFLRGGDTVLVNNFIVENATAGRGAGMAVDSGPAPATIGDLLHNTFAANDDDAVSAGLRSTLRLTNTIFFSHMVGISVITPTAAVTASHTLWSATATLTDNFGAGSISTTDDYIGDPAFVGGEAAHDMRAYHVTHSSAARDKGGSARVIADYDGDPRPFGPFPDIGADEYPFGAGTVYPAQATPCHITYTVLITNGGGSTATMGMTHTLPPGLHYRGPMSCTPGVCGYQAASRTITWIGETPAASTASVTYVLHAGYPAVTATVVHTASISTPMDVFTTSRVTTTVRVRPPTAGTVQRSSHRPSPDGCATIGEPVTYTLYFTLPEGTGVHAPVIVERLPRVVALSHSPSAMPALTYVAQSGVPPPVTVSPDGGTLTWALDTVTAPCGASTVISVALQAQVRNLPENNCADVLQNTALLSYTDATGAASCAVTSAHAITLREPDATLSKTIAPASGAGRGDVLTVTLTFGNDGPSPLYDAVLTDVLPIWMSYRGVVGDTPSPTVSGRVLTWTIASITPGERQVVIFTVRMADDAPLGETLTNTAEIWGSSLPGVQAGERDGDNAIGPAEQLYRAMAQCTVRVLRCVYLPLVLAGAVVFLVKVRG